MKRDGTGPRRRHTRTALLGVVALVAAACGTAGRDDGSPGTVTGAPASQAASTTTSTTPTTTSPASTTVATTAPPEPGRLVAYGDSFAASSGWPTQLAELAADHFGKEFVIGGQICALGCAGLAAVFEETWAREAIAEADIIVIQPRAGRVFTAPFAFHLNDRCGGDDNRDCIREALAEFEIYLDDLLDTALELADPEAVIRTVPAGTWAVDHFYPDLRDNDPETFAVFLEAMIGYIDLVEAASAERCILMTDASALLQGSDYLTPLDPSLTSDGAHLNAAGSRPIAEALHALGYEPTVGSC